MENQGHSAGKSAGKGWLLSLIHTIKHFITALFSNPFKIGLTYFIAGLIPAMIIGWFIFPALLYSKQQQPMNFNHALHMDPEIVEGIKGDTDTERCLFCHSFRDDGSFIGVRGMDTCAKCHNDPDFPWGESDEEALFIKDYVVMNREIQWLTYSRQPDCVYFSHIAHVKMGGLTCNTCHGDHGKSQVLPAYEKNRISSYSRNIWGKNIAGIKMNTWDRMKMDDCAACHIEKGHEKNNACFVCHK